MPFRRFVELFRCVDEPPEITAEAVEDAGRALLAERRVADLLDW